MNKRLTITPQPPSRGTKMKQVFYAVDEILSTGNEKGSRSVRCRGPRC